MAPNPLVTAAEMRAAEQAAIASGAVTGRELMERAGAGAVDAILSEWPGTKGGGRAAVLCGPGNNGGDGFVVARLLARHGWDVTCHLLGGADGLPPDARLNHDRVGLPVAPLGELEPALLETRDLVVDALFGIGLRRPLEGLEALLDALLALRKTSGRTRIVALDVPSGLDADSGRILGETASDAERGTLRSVAADMTVAFGAMKPGHVLADGPARCGAVRVVPIGIEIPAAVREVDRGDALMAAFKIGHKFDHGHALVLSGGVGRGGAARLAARAALRIGAGLVTAGCPPAALIENAAQLNAVMLARVADAEGLSEMLEDERIAAVCVGPGLGLRGREAALVRAALVAGRATVLDADALTLLSRGEGGGLADLHDGCLLTPHLGEFARLFPDIAERLAGTATSGPAYSKIDAVREAAERAGCTVLLKGPDTVIAAPDGRARVNAAVHGREAPWLATAGSGDVLAGIATGLLARGWGPLDAACAAAWLHVECARAFGPGLIAEDLPDLLPQVLGGLAGG